MTVSTFINPNYTTMLAATYKAAIDGDFAAHHRLAGRFLPHQQDASSPQPDMSVRIDVGFIWNAGISVTDIAAQTVSGFTIPSAGQHRVDLVVVDPKTGVASRVAGTAVTGSPSAVAPDIPQGFEPICTVLLTSSDTVITNSMISDKRIPFFPLGSLLLIDLGGSTGDRVRMIAHSSGNGVFIAGVNSAATDYNPLTLQFSRLSMAARTGVLTAAEAMGIDSTSVELTCGRMKFPAIQNASADANTLDDYEKGTWMPSVGGTATYTTQVGRYTKVGNLVFLSVDLTINTIGTGSTRLVSGLPFTPARDGALAMGNYSAAATSSVEVICSCQTTPQLAFNCKNAASAGSGISAFFGSGTAAQAAGCHDV